MSITIPRCGNFHGYGCLHHHHGVLALSFDQTTGDPDSNPARHATYLRIDASLSPGTNLNGFDYPSRLELGPWFIDQITGEITPSDTRLLTHLFQEDFPFQSWQNGGTVGSVTATNATFSLARFVTNFWQPDVVRVNVTLSQEYTNVKVRQDLAVIDSLIPKGDTVFAYPPEHRSVLFWKYDGDTGIASVDVDGEASASLVTPDIVSGYLLHDLSAEDGYPIDSSVAWYFQTGSFGGLDASRVVGSETVWRNAWQFTGRYWGTSQCATTGTIRRRTCQLIPSLTDPEDKRFIYGDRNTSAELAARIASSYCTVVPVDPCNGVILWTPSQSGRGQYYWHTLGATCP